MNFFGSLDGLQQSSVKKRRAVLAVSVTLLMGFVIALWVIQLRILNAPDGKLGESASSVGPFGIIWEAARDNIKDIRRSLYDSN
ncbi:MAG: hypothetical protein O2794_04155 [bacterium]|nr:hypothetical protein [bacterium]